jgi:hypothetical protein
LFGLEAELDLEAELFGIEAELDLLHPHALSPVLREDPFF